MSILNASPEKILIHQAIDQILVSNPLFQPIHVNAHAEEVQNKVNEWVKKNEIIPAPYQEKLQKGRFALLMGGAHPTASESRLFAITKLVTVLFINDDINEQMKVVPLLKMNERNLTILKGDELNLEKDNALTKAFAEVYKDFASLKSDQWMERLVSHFKEHMDATVWEAQNREDKVIPDYETFSQKRDDTGAVKVVLDLVEVATHLNFENKKYAQYFAKINQFANKIICLSNDLLTLEKELGTENFKNNVVCILGKDQGYNPKNLSEAALKKAIELHNHFVKEFIEEEKKILKETKEGSYRREYLQEVKNWINSNYHWSILSERCRIDASLLAQKVQSIVCKKLAPPSLVCSLETQASPLPIRKSKSNKEHL